MMEAPAGDNEDFMGKRDWFLEPSNSGWWFGTFFCFPYIGALGSVPVRGGAAPAED